MNHNSNSLEWLIWVVYAAVIVSFIVGIVAARRRARRSSQVREASENARLQSERDEAAEGVRRQKERDDEDALVEQQRLRRERDDRDAYDLQQRVDDARQRDATAEQKVETDARVVEISEEPQDPGGVKARAVLAKAAAKLKRALARKKRKHKR